MAFEELNLRPLVRRNLEAMGYHSPRPIQAQAIPALLEGRDVIGLAQTGTGKTAAFGVPIVQHLIEDRARRKRPIAAGKRLRALILTPTRELATQVEQEISRLASGSAMVTLSAFGKVGIQPQAQAIAGGVDILVATPGRLRELLDTGNISLESVQILIVDEADRMLDLGFLPQIREILSHLPRTRQTAFFTATFPPMVEGLAREILDHPLRIEASRHTRVAPNSVQSLVRVRDRDKVSLLMHLVQDRDRKGVLVFCRTRRRVGWVGAAVKRHGVRVGLLHGDRTQAQRQRALQQFSDGELQVLVATDVAARGLHVPAVRTVINYDLPLVPEDYVHRVGRAGHGGGFAEGITFISPQDLPRWETISRIAKVNVPIQELAGFEKFVPPEDTRSRSTPSRAAGEHAPGRAAPGDGPGSGPGRGRESRPGRSSGRKSAAAANARVGPKGKKQLKRRRSRNRPIAPGDKPGQGAKRQRRDRE